MKMQMYTMYDVVKQEMGGIMLYKNEAEANRAAEKMFQQLEQNKDSLTDRNDFKVFKIGEIDTESMNSETHTPRILTINATED